LGEKPEDGAQPGRHTFPEFWETVFSRKKSKSSAGQYFYFDAFVRGSGFIGGAPVY
jgi:hypothetical protein